MRDNMEQTKYERLHKDIKSKRTRNKQWEIQTDSSSTEELEEEKGLVTVMSMRSSSSSSGRGDNGGGSRLGSSAVKSQNSDDAEQNK